MDPNWQWECDSNIAIAPAIKTGLSFTNSFTYKNVSIVPQVNSDKTDVNCYYKIGQNGAVQEMSCDLLKRMVDKKNSDSADMICDKKNTIVITKKESS